MLRNYKSGYGVISGPWGEIVEFDTFTCNHCQRIVRIIPKESNPDYGICMGCFELICPRCRGEWDKTNICKHFEKALEKEEKEYRAR
jgi:hypothetical protein